MKVTSIGFYAKTTKNDGSNALMESKLLELSMVEPKQVGINSLAMKGARLFLFQRHGD